LLVLGQPTDVEAAPDRKSRWQRLDKSQTKLKLGIQSAGGVVAADGTKVARTIGVRVLFILAAAHGTEEVFS
jgi:hypothetical protein